MKTCSKCKQNKEYPSFSKHKGMKDGYAHWCKKCYSNKYLSERERVIIRNCKWQKDNAEKVRENHKKYEKKKRQKDPKFKLICNMRNRIYEVLKRNSKSKRTIELLGCSINELKQYLESKFQEGMNWDNYTYTGWHVDHIIPLDSANTKEEVEKLFHYTNLQPLWAKDNLSKSSKII